MVGSRRDRERRGWIRPAPRQKKADVSFSDRSRPPPFLLFLSLTTRICRCIKSDVYRIHVGRGPSGITIIPTRLSQPLIKHRKKVVHLSRPLIKRRKGLYSAFVK
ncbi:hypothetical protein D1872_222320 [compost metagenome]